MIFYYENDNVTEGLDQFTYQFVYSDNTTETGVVEVDLAQNAADDLLSIDLELVDRNGAQINFIRSGEEFGVKVSVDSLVPTANVVSAYTRFVL